MTAQQLKNSILQMAVQGKLVPQDPNDEPASVLLERIKAEKEQLIKDKKIKKEKNPSFIYRGEDNLPYEKIGNNEPVCIADEVPFDIPDSWEWVRLNEICTKLVDGDHNPPKGELSPTNFIMASSTNINNDSIVELEKVRYLSEEVFQKENLRTQAAVGDIFFTSVGSLGRSCIYQGGMNICFQRSVSVITTLIHNYYLKFYLDSDYIQKKINREATGTAQKGFYLNQLSKLLIPLPPLAEQKRIVAKIEELLPYIEKYEKAETHLTQLQADFPEQLKKSILQQAVQGKLVPQDESDEPASVLLERIRMEKQELIKQGKIKKDKHESYIFKRDNSSYEMCDGVERCIDEELPFEIPQSWEWCRLKTVSVINPRNNADDDNDVAFMPMPLLDGGYCSHHTFDVKKWKDIKSGFTHFSKDDIVIAKITPCFQNRKSAIISDIPNNIGSGTTELHVVRCISGVSNEYLLWLFKTAYFIDNGVKAF